MKSKLLFCLIALSALLGISQKSQAQITGVTIDSLSLYPYWNTTCSVPDTAWITFGGIVSGTIPTNDSVTIDINFGDGSDTTYKLWNPQGHYYTYLTHIYTTPGVFAILATVTTSNSITASQTSNGIIIGTSCATLQGDLYVDANSNCVKDAGEVGLPGRIVECQAGIATYYAYSDGNGHYAITLPAGYTYTITPNAAATLSLTATCPASGSASVTVASGSYTENFAYSCSSTGYDASISVVSGNWRPAFPRSVWVWGNNTNVCTNVPAVITVTLPSQLVYGGVYGSYPAPTVSGNVLTWNVASLNAFNYFYSGFWVICDTFATLNDTLCLTANITTTPADANLTNNTVNHCRIISNAVDPNDKNVSPIGSGTNGGIVNGTPLTYLVNFQNTGNDVAYNVTIKDMVDTDLDMNTFTVVKSSHTMKPYINGRELSFRFDNINLPDSGANEPASHGFVVYSIKPKAGLAIGTVINNTANIYFDYNDAIVTNTTLNTIISPSGIQHLSNGTLTALVFPNPANDKVYMELSDSKNFKATLYDMLGRALKTSEGRNGRSSIDLNQLPAGMYMLRLVSEDNKVMSTQLSVGH